MLGEEGGGLGGVTKGGRALLRIYYHVAGCQCCLNQFHGVLLQLGLTLRNACSGAIMGEIHAGCLEGDRSTSGGQPDSVVVS